MSAPPRGFHQRFKRRRGAVWNTPLCRWWAQGLSPHPVPVPAAKPGVSRGWSPLPAGAEEIAWRWDGRAGWDWDPHFRTFTWRHFGASESGESLQRPSRRYSRSTSGYHRLSRHHPQQGRPRGSPRWRRVPSVPSPPHRLPAGCFFYWKVSCFGSGQDMKASREPAPVPPRARRRLRCRLWPSPSCLHRLPVAAAIGTGPAPPPAAAQEGKGLAAGTTERAAVPSGRRNPSLPVRKTRALRVRQVGFCFAGCQPPSPRTLPTPTCGKKQHKEPQAGSCFHLFTSYKNLFKNASEHNI